MNDVFLVCFNILKFSLGDAARMKGEFGGTRYWGELGYMKWNSQRINKEIMFKGKKRLPTISEETLDFDLLSSI